MYINGIPFKSLHFSILRDKLVDMTKRQTYRLGYIRNDGLGDLIAIAFRLPDDPETKKKKYEFLNVLWIVEAYYPRQVHDLTEEEADYDGFTFVEDFKKKLKELNPTMKENHWGFITRGRPIPVHLCEKMPKKKILIKYDHWQDLTYTDGEKVVWDVIHHQCPHCGEQLICECDVCQEILMRNGMV